MVDLIALWVGRAVLIGAGFGVTAAFLWWMLEIVFNRLKLTGDVFEWARDRALRSRRDSVQRDTNGG